MATTGTLEHDALLYSSEEELLDAALPFMLDGRDRGEAVIAVTTSRTIGLMRDALGPAARGVRFIDATDWYVRPAATIAGYNRVLNDLLAAGAPSVRVLGEVQFGGSFGDHAAWTRYESTLNRVFDQSPAWIVCPYDVRLLPPHVVDHAARTHPMLWDTGTRRASDRYLPPETLLQRVNEAAPIPVGSPALSIRITRRASVSGSLGLASGRALLAQTLAAAGLDDDRAADALLAVNEIATNAIDHGGGDATVSIWPAPAWIICEVADRGPGWSDPLAGYVPPARDAMGGMGLWIARQMMDRLSVMRRDGMTVVRLAVRR